jgi:fibronectin type 3 domain-containing protein
MSLNWSGNAESWPQFGGYKIYRSSDLNTKFDLIFSCGLGTGNPIVNSFNDTLTTHDTNYYYSITTFDDGTTTGDILESGPSYTQTITPGQLTSLEDDQNALPTTFQLHQNYPNPFNPTTKINYELPITNYVELSIFNTLGQRVTTLVSEQQLAGRYSVEWDASRYSSGVYYYRIKANKFEDVKKMILLR